MMSERTAAGGSTPAGRPLRILVAARWYPAFDDPGRGSFVADQVAALRDAGHEVVVVSWEHAARVARARAGRVPRAHAGTPTGWLRAIASGVPLAMPTQWGAAGVPVARLPVVALRSSGHQPSLTDAVLAQAQTLRPFVGWLDPRWPIDVIHAHTGVPDGLAALRVARALGLPLVVTEHDRALARHFDHRPTRDAYRGLVADATVIAVSRSLQDRLTTLLGVDRERIRVVPNVVDVAPFAEALARGLPRNADELLWVGARKESKGTDVLLEAFATLSSRDPDLRLRLIGRAPSHDEEMRLRALAAGLGIESRVRFDPPLGRRGVAEAMARAGVFVHPSALETIGIVAAEALAAGLPVAAIPSGAVEEILGDTGAFGVVARGRGPADLADAIQAVRSRPGGFDPRRLQAHAERYAPPVVTARLEELYRAALASPLARPVRRSRPFTVPLQVARPGPDDVPPLVVGLVRVLAARRVGGLPPELAERLVVVTSRERPNTHVPVELPGPADWIEVDPDARYQEALASLGGPLPPRPLAGRVARAIRHPVRALRLRRLRGRRVALRGPAVRDALLAARAVVAARRPTPDGPVPVVALDADDVTTIEATVRSETILLGTTLRGLADIWTPDRRSGAGSSEDSAPAAVPSAELREGSPDPAPERRRDDGSGS
jgi:D-inositol-3-phosphate glycosyltransferase